MSFTLRPLGVKTQQRTQATGSSEDIPPPSPDDIKIITWNVDGLCERALVERSKAAARIILRENPDIITLQEVVYASANIYVNEFCKNKNYVIASQMTDDIGAYFTMTFQHKRLQLVDAWRQPYTGAANSNMGRDMSAITVQRSSGSPRLLVIGTHLESCKESARVREHQLECAFHRIQEHNGPAIVCGDLNLRDAEYKEAIRRVARLNVGDGKLYDAYECAGKPRDQASTWTLYNAPHIMKRTYRFDRVYYTQKGGMRLKEFRLIGKETLGAPINSPASDHFGILTVFSLPSTGRKLDSASAADPKEDNAGPSEPSSSSSSRKRERSTSPNVKIGNFGDSFTYAGQNQSQSAEQKVMSSCISYTMQSSSSAPSSTAFRDETLTKGELRVRRLQALSGARTRNATENAHRSADSTHSEKDCVAQKSICYIKSAPNAIISLMDDDDDGGNDGNDADNGDQINPRKNENGHKDSQCVEDIKSMSFFDILQGSPQANGVTASETNILQKHPCLVSSRKVDSSQRENADRNVGASNVVTELIPVPEGFDVEAFRALPFELQWDIASQAEEE
jgi:tyrosyl-DNA phosphodiesterase 2